MLMLHLLVASLYSSSTMKARTDAMGISLQHADGEK